MGWTDKYTIEEDVLELCEYNVRQELWEVEIDEKIWRITLTLVYGLIGAVFCGILGWLFCGIVSTLIVFLFMEPIRKPVAEIIREHLNKKQKKELVRRVLSLKKPEERKAPNVIDKLMVMSHEVNDEIAIFLTVYMKLRAGRRLPKHDEKMMQKSMGKLYRL